ncbi:MAG: hypothetical protein ACJAZ3_001214 [Sphingobacteriales bacterium]|jgi:hypothetical protein
MRATLTICALALSLVVSPILAQQTQDEPRLTIEENAVRQANKTSKVGGSRWYNHSKTLADPQIYKDVPVFQDSILFNFSNKIDRVFTHYLATVLDPTAFVYTTGGPADIVIKDDNEYSVDSVSVPFRYNRNINRYNKFAVNNTIDTTDNAPVVSTGGTTYDTLIHNKKIIVDSNVVETLSTLIIDTFRVEAFNNSTDTFYKVFFTDSNQTFDILVSLVYMVDTLPVNLIPYNAASNSINMSTKVVNDLLLDSAFFATNNGAEFDFKSSVGATVTAGNLAGLGYSFVPGFDHHNVTRSVVGTVTDSTRRVQTNSDTVFNTITADIIDSIEYEISDGVNLDTAWIYIKVTSPVAGTPNAVDDHFTILRDSTMIVNVQDNDTDPDNLALNTIEVIVDGTNGTATVIGSDSISYAPGLSFVGTDFFTYSVSNLTKLDTATVFITVVDTPLTALKPIASNRNYELAQSIISVMNALDNDIDPEDDALTVAILTSPTNGVATIVNDSISYTPDQIDTVTTIDSTITKVYRSAIVRTPKAIENVSGFNFAQIRAFEDQGNGQLPIFNEGEFNDTYTADDGIRYSQMVKVDSADSAEMRITSNTLLGNLGTRYTGNRHAQVENLDVAFLLSCATCFTVSLPSYTNNAESSMYPNPISRGSEVRLEAVVTNAAAGSLEIIDLTGRTVAKMDLGMLKAGKAQLTVNTGKLPSGQYLINLMVGKDRFVQQLVVN